MNFSKIGRWIVVGKFTLQRGYTLLNVPFLALMGAGVLAPYAKQYFPWMKMWQLAIIAFAAMMAAGLIDKYARLLHLEQSYAVETNPLLMKGLNLDKDAAKDAAEEEEAKWK